MWVRVRGLLCPVEGITLCDLGHRLSRCHGKVEAGPRGGKGFGRAGLSQECVLSKKRSCGDGRGWDSGSGALGFPALEKLKLSCEQLLGTIVSFQAAPLTTKHLRTDGGGDCRRSLME